MNKKPVRNVNRWNGKEESAGDCSGGIPPGSGACVRQAPRGRKEKGEGRASSRCPLGSIWRPVRDAGEGDGAAPLEEVSSPQREGEEGAWAVRVSTGERSCELRS